MSCSSPRCRSTCMALALTWMPAPTSPNCGACNKSARTVQEPSIFGDFEAFRARRLRMLLHGTARSAGVGRARQQFLDLDRDPVALHHHDAGGHREVVGENANLVVLGRVEF